MTNPFEYGGVVSGGAFCNSVNPVTGETSGTISGTIVVRGR